jgi:aspartokinase
VAVATQIGHCALHITCIIEEGRVVDAVRALHEAFALVQE